MSVGPGQRDVWLLTSWMKPVLAVATDAQRGACLWNCSGSSVIGRSRCVRRSPVLTRLTRRDVTHPAVSVCSQLFGESNKSIVDFVLASAAASNTPAALFTALHALGLPNTPAAHAFASDVHARVPRKHKHPSATRPSGPSRKELEREARSVASQRYGLLLDDEPSEPVPSSSKSKSKSQVTSSPSLKKKDRHLRKRDTEGRDWESDEDEDDQAQAKRIRADDYHPPSESGSPPPPAEDDELPTAEEEDAARDRDRK